MNDCLAKRGVWRRALGAPRRPRHVRVTVGLPNLPPPQAVATPGYLTAHSTSLLTSVSHTRSVAKYSFQAGESRLVVTSTLNRQVSHRMTIICNEATFNGPSHQNSRSIRITTYQVGVKIMQPTQEALRRASAILVDSTGNDFTSTYVNLLLAPTAHLDFSLIESQ